LSAAQEPLALLDQVRIRLAAVRTAIAVRYFHQVATRPNPDTAHLALQE